MKKPIIFISHITEERVVAHQLKDLLARLFLGMLDVFVSSHEESIQLGDKWLTTIEKSINSCEMIIVLSSPLSVTRPWINFEAGAGWAQNIPVIPLCHSGLTPSQLPVPLNSFQGGFLNNHSDICSLLKRIASLNEIDTPALVVNDRFFEEINRYESDTQANILFKDSFLVWNLLFNDISLIQRSILASCTELQDMANLNSGFAYFQSFKISFNKIYNCYNVNLLFNFFDIRVFQLFHQSIQKVSDSIKFILSNTHLKLASNLEDLLYKFLFSVVRIDGCINSISLWANQVPKNQTINLGIIQMIKNNKETPPLRQPSNAINAFIDYYEALEFFQKWIVEFYSIMKLLLRHDDLLNFSALVQAKEEISIT